MNSNLRSILGIILVGLFLYSVFAWSDTAHSSPEVRIPCTLLAIGILAILIKAEFKNDLAPNFLGNNRRAILERDGFCFIPVITENAVIIHFQCKYDSPCSATVILQPKNPTLSQFPTNFRIECDKGAAGIATFPVDLEKRLTMELDVHVSISHPQGKGRMIRFKEHTMLSSSILTQTPNAAMNAALIPMGAVMIGRPGLSLDCTVLRTTKSEPPPIPGVRILWDTTMASHHEKSRSSENAEIIGK